MSGALSYSITIKAAENELEKNEVIDVDFKK
jgi:hypothetical protein